MRATGEGLIGPLMGLPSQHRTGACLCSSAEEHLTTDERAGSSNLSRGATRVVASIYSVWRKNLDEGWGAIASTGFAVRIARWCNRQHTWLWTRRSRFES